MPDLVVPTVSVAQKPTRDNVITLLKTLLRNLTSVQGSVDIAHSIILKFTLIMNKIGGYIADALSFLNFVDNILKALKEGVRLCKYLGELIPKVGPLLAKAASFIEQLRIETVVGEIVRELKRVITFAKDTIVAKVNKVLGPVAKYLGVFREELMSWIYILKITGAGVDLYDMLADLILGDETEDPLSKAFHHMASKISGQFQAIQSALKPLYEFIGTIWDEIKAKIIKPLEEGFGKILEVFRPVMTFVKDCISKCNTIQSWFEPFFSILDCVKWVWDHTIGWLVNKVLKELGLEKFIKNLVDKVKDALGITAIEKKIRTILEEVIGKAYGPLAEILKGDAEVGSLAYSVLQFRTTISNFQHNPMQAVWKLITGMAEQPGQKGKLGLPPIRDQQGRRIWTAEKKRLRYSRLAIGTSSMLIMETGPDECARRFVDTKQQEMDAFVGNWQGDLGADNFTTQEVSKLDIGFQTSKYTFNPWQAESEPMARTFTSANHVPEPYSLSEITLALHDDVPVSIKLRTFHSAVIKRQQTAVDSSKVLPRLRDRLVLSTLAASSPDADRLPPPAIDVEFKSKFRSRFLSFHGKYESLNAALGDGQRELRSLVSAVQVSDVLFAAHTDDAKEFVIHLQALMTAFDEPLSDIAALCGSPLQYKQVLQERVVPFCSRWGWESAANFFDGLFQVLEGIGNTLQELETDRKTMMEGSVRLLAEKFVYMTEQVTRIVSLERVCNRLGPGVKDLSSLVAAIQRQIDSVRQTFTFLNSLGEVLIANEKRLGESAPSIYRRLDTIFVSVEPLMDRYIENLKKTEEAVDAVYNALVPLHKQVTDLFDAVSDVSNSCFAIEGHLIAVDGVKKMLHRLALSIRPFEGILNDLGIRKDMNALESYSLISNDELADRIEPQTISWVLELLPEISISVMDALIKTFFNTDKIREGIDGCLNKVSGEVTEAIKVFDTAVCALIDLTAPPRIMKFTAQTTAGGVEVALPNSIMDDSSAKMIKDLFAELSIMSEGVRVPGNDVNPGPQDILLSRWARSDIMGEALIDLKVLAWGRAWDSEHQGKHPSDAWLEWYDNLERIDRLVEQGQLQKILNRPRFDFPSATNSLIAGSLDPLQNIGRWHSRFVAAPARKLTIDAFIGEVVRLYRETIQHSLVLPLRSRIKRLTQGITQLENGPGDILCVLASGVHGVERQVDDDLTHRRGLQTHFSNGCYTLPGLAIVRISAEFYEKSVSYREMRELVTQLETFDSIGPRLWKLLDIERSRTVASISHEPGLAQAIDWEESLLGLQLLHDAYFLAIAKRMYFDLWRTSEDDMRFLLAQDFYHVQITTEGDSQYQFKTKVKGIKSQGILTSVNKRGRTK